MLFMKDHKLAESDNVFYEEGDMDVDLEHFSKLRVDETIDNIIDSD